VVSENAILLEVGHDITPLYDVLHALLAHHDGFQLI
jgi:hypothetical protein